MSEPLVPITIIILFDHLQAFFIVLTMQSHIQASIHWSKYTTILLLIYCKITMYTGIMNNILKGQRFRKLSIQNNLLKMCQSKILSLLNFTPKRPNPCAKYSDQLISKFFCCIFAEIQLCLFIVFGIINGQVISWHWNTLQIRKCGGHLMYQRNGKN